MKITRDMLEDQSREDLIELVHVIQSVINLNRLQELSELAKEIRPLYEAAEKEYFSFMAAYSAATHPSLKRKYEKELVSARSDYESIGKQLREIYDSRPRVEFFDQGYTGPIG